MESSSAEGDYRAVLFTTVNMSVQIRAKGNLKVREAAWHSNLILKPAGKVCSGAVSRTQASQGTRPFNLTFRTTNAGFSVDVFFFSLAWSGKWVRNLLAQSQFLLAPRKQVLLNSNYQITTKKTYVKLSYLNWFASVSCSQTVQDIVVVLVTSSNATQLNFCF